MKLQTLIRDMDTMEVRGDVDIPVTGIAYDSREVSAGDIFVCLEGLTVDGHAFAPATVDQGAASLVVHRWLDSSVPQVRVADTRLALAQLSARFFGNPSLDLVMVGITGTNGKTTVTHFLQGIGQAAGRKTRVFGTLGTTGFTTPEAPRLQAMLRDAATEAAQWVAMECSSHALHQRRTVGTHFDVVIFTNLSRDHLDYHPTMDAYFEAKALLFETTYRKTGGMAVICIDDPYGRRLWERVTGPKHSYGFSEDADFRAVDVQLGVDQSTYTLVVKGSQVSVRLNLPGRYNILNALAAQGAALHLGVDLDTVSKGVGRVATVPGRMERVPGSHNFNVFVDYAHTPEALSFALGALREITAGALWVVFGCGGDRDQGKRSMMGATAERLADHVVLTSDNPRSEDPEVILQNIAGGLNQAQQAHIEVDRGAAIRWALRKASPGDTVLIAGKGHEGTQTLKHGVIDFDDSTVAADAIKELDDRGN